MTINTNNTKFSFSPTVLNILVFILYFICILPACIFAFKKPQYNWDMLPYMASIIKLDHSNIGDIHTLTYQSAKENIPADKYESLINANAYTKRMAESATEFNEQLPFYLIKPLYIASVCLFYRSGFSLPKATVLPSILFYLLSSLLLFCWIKKYLKLPVAFFISLLTCYSFFMIYIALISSPDFLSAFLLFASFYFIIERPIILAVFILFMLAILARADNIILCILTLSLLTFSGKWSKRISLTYYLIMAVLLLGCYFGVIAAVSNYGWSKLFYPTFFNYLHLDHTVHTAFSLKEYIGLLYSKAISGILSSHLTIFLLLEFFLLKDLAIKGFRAASFNQLFSLLLVGVIFIRFLLFPDISDRFYIAFYLFMIVALVINYSNNFVEKKMHGYE